MALGKSDGECGPFSQLAFYSYPAPMPGNNFLADSQANSRSFISRSSVQSFQRDENPLRKLFIQPDSVILHRNFPAPVLAGLPVQMDNGGGCLVCGTSRHFQSGFAEVDAFEKGRRQDWAGSQGWPFPGSPSRASRSPMTSREITARSTFLKGFPLAVI